MVHGKAYLRVTIDPRLYFVGTLNACELNLSDLTLGFDAAAKNDWDCSSADSDLARASGHFLAGCTTAATSSKLPTGLEDVEPLKS